uniref:IRS-type PTB domain-containing protein n=1 Tax=Ascaris lumbricoides TaxID=6252 RepID=A0A9J2Q1L3_ASCLU
MVGYTCPIRSSQFSQTNDRSWNLAKYTKLRDGKEDALTAESRLCVVINMSRRCLSVLSGKTTLEEMSLIGLPTPIVKTRDHDVFFRLSSHEGNVLAKFRIKFLTTLDRCAFTALLSNYVEVISADGNRTSRAISQPTSRNDSSFLFHSQTQSQRENLPLGSCSQSSTSSYASMQSLLQLQSTQNTCSQNTTQRSLVCSTFSSQSSQMVSQSTNAFSQNTSAFSQPLSIFSQSTTGLSSSLSSNRSHFSNAKEANLSYEHDDRLSQKVQDTSSGASCQNSLLSFTSFSQGFSKSGSLDGENERASSQPNSTLFNTTKSSTAETLAAHVDSVIRSVTTKLPTSDDQVVPSIDAEDKFLFIFHNSKYFIEEELSKIFNFF